MVLFNFNVLRVLMLPWENIFLRILRNSCLLRLLLHHPTEIAEHQEIS